MEVRWLLGEEVGSETLVGVQEDSVDIVVELSGHVLGKELNLVDQVTALGSLCGGGLSSLFVVDLDGLMHISWLNLCDVEAGSECVVGAVAGVEQIVEGGGGESLMFLVDLSEDNWVHADRLLEGGSLSLGLVVDLGEACSELGRADESHDVGVMLEDKNLLGRCLIVSSRSDSNN
jgi:hypothetical protein